MTPPAACSASGRKAAPPALRWNHAYTFEGPAFYVLGNNQAPTVNLTAPTAGASYTTPVSISISASAYDFDGQVSKVEFYSGATLLGTVPGPTSNAASYNFTWANAPAGTHTLTARATDSNGAVSASAALAITVVTPAPLPPVVFSGPPTEHFYNGAGQRTVRVQPEQQSVYVYGQEGHTVLAEVQRNLSSNVLTTTEHIYLPTASGPMPVAVVLNGAHYAVHTDHLNTPRRLTNSAGQPVWQWAFSGFGEVPAQALPPAGQAAVNYNLRFPGQVDDGNGLFYNWHRFYDPSSGRYVSSDPIGLEGGWNRFEYVGGNPLGAVDPEGLQSRGAPPPQLTYSGSISATRVTSLLNQIRQYNRTYTYSSVRASRGPGSEYTNADVASLMGILRGHQNPQTCSRNGVTVGRFIADQNGNVMVEPAGGSTGPYPPHRPNSPDTHTYYPNGSNYMRINPQGHGPNTTPHGHGHLPGTGTGRSGQGSSTDIFGNPVPSNSGAAHWPTY